MSVDNKIVVYVNKFSSYAVFRVTIDVTDGYAIYRTNWTKFWLQTMYVYVWEQEVWTNIVEILLDKIHKQQPVLKLYFRAFILQAS